MPAPPGHHFKAIAFSLPLKPSMDNLDHIWLTPPAPDDVLPALGLAFDSEPGLAGEIADCSNSNEDRRHLISRSTPR